jgi:hypothetical protein
MKNKRVFAGMLAITLVFGLIIIGCPIDNNNNDGDTNPLKETTWLGSGSDQGGVYSMTYTFDETTYTATFAYTNGTPSLESGTYSVSGDTVSFTDEDGGTFSGIVSGETLIINSITYYKQ